LSNAWPQVRQAALSRIEGPCSEDDLDRLAKLGGPVDKGGDSDGAVARAATQALGRCGGDEAWSRLTKQLKNDDAPMEQRAEAGRQLIKYGGPEGLDAVAKVLHRGDLQRALVRRLAASFRFAEAPTDDAAEALCGRLDDGGEVALAAAQSLRKLYAGTDINPCVEE
jgi:HEAT repeat protein